MIISVVSGTSLSKTRGFFLDSLSSENCSGSVAAKDGVDKLEKQEIAKKRLMVI